VAVIKQFDRLVVNTADRFTGINSSSPPVIVNAMMSFFENLQDDRVRPAISARCATGFTPKACTTAQSSKQWYLCGGDEG
jgi:hypothetical protein